MLKKININNKKNSVKVNPLGLKFFQIRTTLLLLFYFIAFFPRNENYILANSWRTACIVGGLVLNPAPVLWATGFAVLVAINSQ